MTELKGFKECLHMTSAHIYESLQIDYACCSLYSTSFILFAHPMKNPYFTRVIFSLLIFIFFASIHKNCYESSNQGQK